MFFWVFIMSEILCLELEIYGVKRKEVCFCVFWGVERIYMDIRRLVVLVIVFWYFYLYFLRIFWSFGIWVFFRSYELGRFLMIFYFIKVIKNVLLCIKILENSFKIISLMRLILVLFFVLMSNVIRFCLNIYCLYLEYSFIFVV